MPPALDRAALPAHPRTMDAAQPTTNLAAEARDGMAIRRARLADVEGIHALLRHFSEQGVLLPRSPSDLYANFRDFWVITAADSAESAASGADSVDVDADSVAPAADSAHATHLANVAADSPHSSENSVDSTQHSVDVANNPANFAQHSVNSANPAENPTATEAIIACGALQIFTRELGEVRSLAVAPGCRQRGLGASLVRRIEAEARQLGLRRLMALTYVVDFFGHLGFAVVPMKTLPEKVWGACINCHKFRHCDEIAVLKYLH